MSAIARMGDSISHGGSITGGSGDTKANSIGVARVGDSATCSEHGSVTIVSGSSTVKVNGRAVARVGDSLSCGATITGGSGNVNSG